MYYIYLKPILSIKFVARKLLLILLMLNLWDKTKRRVCTRVMLYGDNDTDVGNMQMDT